ncbi:glycerophosphodiester phosphodiesterase family protein [Lacinutrix salivirga]
MKKLILLLLIVSCWSCKNTNSKTPVSTETISTEIKPSVLLETFRYTPNATPIISVHRGGKGLKNYPENCLETLQYINNSISSAIYEIDVAQTKDSVLVLLHDTTLERTTTGTGNINKYTYKELQAFNLKDDFGNTTNFKIPLLKDVLIWAKAHNVVLTLDKKRSVAFKTLVNLVKEQEAEDVSILITYDLKQSNEAYNLAPNLLLSVSARNAKELNWLLNSEIPTENMFAFTGTRLSSDSLYKAIHDKKIMTILGTLGNLDKQAEAKGDQLYKTWSDKGIDVFATDRPFEAAKALGVLK